MGFFSPTRPTQADRSSTKPHVGDQILAGGFGQLNDASVPAQAGFANRALWHSGGIPTSLILGTRTVGGDHFEVSGDGIRAKALVTDAVYTWTGCTASNAFGTSDQFTLVIPTRANVYTVSSDAEADTVAAISVATRSGKSMEFRYGRSYTWTELWWNGAHTSLWTIASADPDNKARIVSSGSVQNTALTSVRFQSIDMYFPFELGVDNANGAAWLWRDTNDDVTFDDCDIASNLLELVQVFGYPANIISYTWRGIFGSDGNTLVSNVTITNCTMRGSWRLYNMPGGPFTIEDNVFYDWGADAIVPGGDIDNSSYSRNISHSPLSSPADSNHGDFFQPLPATNITGLKINGNVHYAGRFDNIPTKHVYQGIFLEDIFLNNYTVECVDNLVVTAISHGITIYNSANSTIANNTVVINTDWDTSPSAYPFIRTLQSMGHTVFGNVIADNVSPGHSSFNSSDRIQNNVDIDPATTGQADSYDELFAGPSFTGFKNIQEVIAAFQPKSGGRLDSTNLVPGSEGNTYTDATTAPRFNDSVSFTGLFTDVTGAAEETVVRSNLITPGSIPASGLAVGVSGSTVEFRIKSNAVDDDTGVLVDWTSDDAVMFAGESMQLRLTTGDMELTVHTADVLVGRTQGDTWTVTTDTFQGTIILDDDFTTDTTGTWTEGNASLGYDAVEDALTLTDDAVFAGASIVVAGFSVGVHSEILFTVNCPSGTAVFELNINDDVGETNNLNQLVGNSASDQSFILSFTPGETSQKVGVLMRNPTATGSAVHFLKSITLRKD